MNILLWDPERNRFRNLAAFNGIGWWMPGARLSNLAAFLASSCCQLVDIDDRLLDSGWSKETRGHVDKELLDALDDAQKQLLFCQMRAEQVRKWQANEERLEREGAPKKKSNKRGIKWLTGADGEVWVWVMGDHPLDKSIEEILEEEARQEAHNRALKELTGHADTDVKEPEEALKAQLGQMRVGVTDSIYDDSDASFDPSHPLLFQPVRRELAPNGNAPTNGSSPPRPIAVTSTTVSSFTTPQPQKAELRGPPPPIPARPPNLTSKAVVQGQNAPVTMPVPTTSWQDTLLANGVKMRPPRELTPEQKAEDVQKRESEIFQSIQEKRERIRREAEAESERQRLEWEQQNQRAREAEEAMRKMAQKAREQHRQLIRTSTSILPALKDTKATSLREAIKNLPRPPKPKSRAAIVDWFKRDEWPRGTGQDPKTRMPAPWFHGIISRDQAEILLQDKPTGSFLVRVSERIWGYTVSYVVGDGTFKHFLVERIPEGYQFLGTNQVVHDQLFDLISYHETAPITAKGGEILKWSVGQMFRPPDYHDIVPDAAFPQMNRLFEGQKRMY
ncbi:SH2 domain protein [Ancylostoma duodenale]|uniref:SH2 domain protein n=1 Tax=Ancylostoma duodenale TaxID=51022 RepID=A0A0C2GR61_9BILA|nr:SH2 domain protein [Ancylostoma duodenale]